MLYFGGAPSFRQLVAPFLRAIALNEPAHLEENGPSRASPRRAVVYLTWGDGQEAAVRGSVAGSRLPYDVFWITDSEPREPIEGVVVVPAEFSSHDGHRPKSELARYLPGGYDSYLFLDSDTRVLGDVTLGFELAEKDGLAMVPAVKYSLAEYFDGRSLMRELGIPEKGQQVYNSGVVFFAARPEILQLWRTAADLAARFGARSDQLVLQLAMELAGIRPACLSPNFNCRGFGERLIGEVRIWHQPGDPPADINRAPWVDRRVVRGRTRRWNGVGLLRTPYRWVRGPVASGLGREVSDEDVME